MNKDETYKYKGIELHIPENSTPYEFFMFLIRSEIVPAKLYFKGFVFDVRCFYKQSEHWYIVFDVNTDIGKLHFNYCIKDKPLTWDLFENALFVTAEGVKVHARA